MSGDFIDDGGAIERIPGTTAPDEVADGDALEQGVRLDLDAPRAPKASLSSLRSWPPVAEAITARLASILGVLVVR